MITRKDILVKEENLIVNENRIKIVVRLLLVITLCVLWSCSGGGGKGGDGHDDEDTPDVVPELQSISTVPSTLEFTDFEQETQLKIILKYNDETTEDVTAAQAGTAYLTDNPGIVSISKNGLVKPLASGGTAIKIIGHTLSASIPVKVDIAPSPPAQNTKDAFLQLENQIGSLLCTGWNPKNGLPASMHNPGGYLSEPSALPPSEIFQKFITDHQALYKLSVADLADFPLVSNYVSQHNGVSHLVMKQYYQGIQVFGAQLQSAINKEGKIINVVGSYYPVPA